MISTILDTVSTCFRPAPRPARNQQSSTCRPRLLCTAIAAGGVAIASAGTNRAILSQSCTKEDIALLEPSDPRFPAAASLADQLGLPLHTVTGALSSTEPLALRESCLLEVKKAFEEATETRPDDIAVKCSTERTNKPSLCLPPVLLSRIDTPFGFNMSYDKVKGEAEFLEFSAIGPKSKELPNWLKASKVFTMRNLGGFPFQEISTSQFFNPILPQAALVLIRENNGSSFSYYALDLSNPDHLTVSPSNLSAPAYYSTAGAYVVGANMRVATNGISLLEFAPFPNMSIINTVDYSEFNVTTYASASLMTQDKSAYILGTKSSPFWGIGVIKLDTSEDEIKPCVTTTITENYNTHGQGYPGVSNRNLFMAAFTVTNSDKRVIDKGVFGMMLRDDCKSGIHFNSSLYTFRSLGTIFYPPYLSLRSTLSTVTFQTQTGLASFDISDPGFPKLATQTPLTQWGGEYNFYGDLIYLTSTNRTRGYRIIDIADFPDALPIVRVQSDTRDIYPGLQYSNLWITPDLKYFPSDPSYSSGTWNVTEVFKWHLSGTPNKTDLGLTFLNVEATSRSSGTGRQVVPLLTLN